MKSCSYTRHGLSTSKEWFRLPVELFSNLRPQVVDLAKQTAGGRIRFATDAGNALIRIRLADTVLKTHMTPWNMAGGELYAGRKGSFRRIAALRPKALGQVLFHPLDGYSLSDTIEETVALCGKPETYTLYLPSFNGISDVEILLPDEDSAWEPDAYSIPKPIVFYGSSITQGACAGRPALSYPARVCAALDADFINLGFAGNALGEPEIAAYISKLEMSCFVLDYDYNAPTVEHLAKTHFPFYQIIRKVQPELPILMISKPYGGCSEQEAETRFQIISDSYRKAVNTGDSRVALLDGRTFFPAGKEDSCLMDFIHPNDYGFAYMAEKVLPEVKKLLHISI